MTTRQLKNLAAKKGTEACRKYLAKFRLQRSDATIGIFMQVYDRVLREGGV